MKENFDDPDIIDESIPERNLSFMARSRLSKRAIRNTKKDVVFTILGIFVVLFLLAKFGLPLLINATLFVSGSKDTSDTSSQKETKFVAPPSLLSSFDATNSAQISVKGQAQSGQTVDLYVNDEKTDSTSVGNNNSFEFTNVKLTKGQNEIKAKATDSSDKTAKSDFSNTLTIEYKSGNPKLTVDSPSDNQTYSKDSNQAQVKGKTDPGDKVYVNNFWAIVDDAGNFSYNLPLQNGDTTVDIVATDDAGNKTEVKRKVTYNP